MSSKKETSVKVIVRCRPLNSKEKEKQYANIIEFQGANTGRQCAVSVNHPGGAVAPKRFTFDLCYDWNSVQKDVYDQAARPIVQSVLDGFNGTIFAYGQTGTGKTFTMEGVRDNPELKGIIPHSFDHIFDAISNCKEGQQYLVRASYLEIYSEEIRDLLSKNQGQRLELKQRPDSGVYVKDLMSFVVKSVAEIERVMTVGNKNRKVASTDMNAHSSRSHAIFMITVECSELGIDGENHIRVGKLNLVDLAGSERQSKTGATGDRLKEGIMINKSLSTLGLVMTKLVEGEKHIPYRDSKLTRLLEDSLGGNAKTAMIAAFGPAEFNFDETCNTLGYANRAKKIKNKPKINEDPKDALLRDFQEQIAMLKAKLEGEGGGKKRRKRPKRRQAGVNEHGEPVDENGEVIDDDDDDDDDDDEPAGPEDAEALYQEERAKLEEEREALARDAEMSVQERERIAADIEKRSSDLKKEKKAKEQLAKQIEAMKTKLLGKPQIEKMTKEKKRELRERRKQQSEAELKRHEAEAELRKRREVTADAQASYDSKQAERDDKTKKLKKLYKKFQEAKLEIDDLQEEFAQAREELYQTTYDLQKELKLRQMIIEHFIPPEEAAKIRARSAFHEELDQWKLAPIGNTAAGTEARSMLPRPVSAIPGNRHPITQDAKMRAQMDRSTGRQNTRFRPENIYLVELEMPERTTADYLGPAVDPRVQAALDEALRDEEDLDLEAEPDDFLLNGMRKARDAERGKRRAKPRGDGERRRKPKKPPAPSGDDMPAARGLVRPERPATRGAWG